MSSDTPASSQIPDIVIGRLPVYLRALERLAQEDHKVTSSHELGQRLGISSAQIRKDLSHFGGFGKQGTGYHIDYLTGQLKSVLNVDRVWPVALVGAGDLGRAVANYRGFTERSFHIACVFDTDPAKMGQQVGQCRVQDFNQAGPVIRRLDIRVAMIAVPAASAQVVADLLAGHGVRAILNYAPINLNVAPGVRVQHIDPVVHLQHMTYYLSD
ncbi:MAG: redox-sensing transcriptional repressor Rex [Anaerolineaceae bacterium]|nr:redox-sensing transcriptional repressor Rex [Anaerolineaceae bacterium]